MKLLRLPLFQCTEILGVGLGSVLSFEFFDVWGLGLLMDYFNNEWVVFNLNFVISYTHDAHALVDPFVLKL